MPHIDEDAKRSYQKDWMINRRLSWIMSQGGVCAQCGGTESLEVDHIDATLKTMNPARLWSLSDANPIKISELGNCQVLCHMCHKEKTRLQKMKEYSHGDYGMYKKRGCRCRPCKDANTARKRSERAERKIELGNHL